MVIRPIVCFIPLDTLVTEGTGVAKKSVPIPGPSATRKSLAGGGIRVVSYWPFKTHVVVGRNFRDKPEFSH